MAASLLLVTGVAGVDDVAAHGADGPSLDAESQELRQGEAVVVVGHDFEPGEQVVLELWASGNVRSLGSADVAAEGHFVATVTVPDDVEDGYAEIQATSASGTSAALVLLVGEGPDLSEGLPAPPPNATPIWTDPAAIVLMAFLGAGILAVLYAASRRGNPQPAGRRTRRSAGRRS